MSDEAPHDERPPATGNVENGPEPGVDEVAPDEAAQGQDSGGLRLIGAVVTLPWMLLYGITGVWAVTLAAQSASRGLKQLDAGYTRFVTPAQLGFVGALLLTAFAVMLACGLLLLFGRRSGMAWLPLLLVAAGLTAGALWAGIQGELHPLLWVLFFFGPVYVVVIAAVKLLHVTRAERRDTIAPP
jgi:hypothetical protein